MYRVKQASDKSYSAAAKSTVPTYKKKTVATTTTDTYAGWTKYCSDYGGVCFKYPQGWQAKSTDTDEPAVHNVTLVSPSGQIEIIYQPLVDGIGGVCEPNTCFFQAFSIAKPVTNNVGTLKVVKGIYTNKESQVTSPDYYVSDDRSIGNYHLTVGKNEDVGFFVNSFSNPSRSGIEFLYVRDVNQAANGYDSVDTASAWFSKDEVVTAGQILSSVELK